MIELHPPQHPSKSIAGIAFEGDTRGKCHVQFQNTKGEPTARGYYADVPRALFNALERDRKPGSIVSNDLKPRFEWVPLVDGEEAVIDPTLPLVVVVPANVPDNAIAACIDAQRIQVVKATLF